MAKYHVTAWGSPELPDIDEEMDEYPQDLFWKYQVVEVTLLTPVAFSAVTRALEG